LFNKSFKELVSGTIPVLFVRFLAMFTSYIFTFMVSRLYGANAMGYFALSQTLLMIFSVISRLGLDSAAVKFISQTFYNNQFNKMRIIYFEMIKLIIYAGSIISFLLFLSSTIMANHIMKNPEMDYIIKITSFAVLPFALLFFHSECFRALKKMVYYSIFRNMTPMFLASIILLIFYYNVDISFIHPIYSYLLSVILLSIISFLLWIFKLPKSDKNNFSITKKELFSVSMPMLLTSSIFFIFYWITILFLSIYCTPTEIGVYDVAFKISMVISIALFAASGIAAPKFAELYSSKKLKELKDVIRKTTNISFFIATPLFLIIVLFSETILGFFGSEFILGKSTLVLLSVGQFIHCLSGPVMNIFQMTGREKKFQKIVVVTLFINLFLSIVLIPNFGFKGAAISNMISMMVWNLTSVFFIKKDFNILTINIFK